MHDPEQHDSWALETKQFSFSADLVVEEKIGGSNIGRVCGYASTYGNVDRVGDRVMPGAFRDTIQKYADLKRPIRAYFQHDSKEIIGAFSADRIVDDARGLYVECELNLDVQRAREVYALAKQGVLSDLSIGYTVNDFDVNEGIRELKSVDLWEISVVSEPANPEARITSVKSIKDLKKIIKKKSDLEKLLRDARFSRSAAKYIASLVDLKKLDESLEKEEDEGVSEEKDVELCEEVTIDEIPTELVDEIADIEEKSETETIPELAIEEADPTVSDDKIVIDKSDYEELLSSVRNLILTHREKQ